MNDPIKQILRDAITAKAHLLYDEALIDRIARAASWMTQCLRRKGKILVCGNGGSAADSQHLAAEIVGRFQKERKGWPAVALTTDTSILTSLANDYAFDIVFARQVEALATSKDILLAISTSGQAKNVLAAVKAAKKIGAKTIGLTGKNGGGLAKTADLALVMPGETTARIQELHVCVIHILCELIEDVLSSKKR
jgi:D-sedoheptulose 7-phosphate isomerase